MWNKISDIEDRFLLLSDMGFRVNIEKGFLYETIPTKGDKYFQFKSSFDNVVFMSENVLSGYKISISGDVLTKDAIKSFYTISLFTGEIAKATASLEMDVIIKPFFNSVPDSAIGIIYNGTHNNTMEANFYLSEEPMNWKHIRSVLYDLIQWRITFRNLAINVDNDFRYVSFFMMKEDKYNDEQESIVYKELKDKYDIIKSDSETLNGFFINPVAFPNEKDKWSITRVPYIVPKPFYKIKL